MRKNKASPILERHSERLTLNVEFGFIVDIIADEEETYYLAIVAKERGVLPADSELAMLPLAHTVEELTSLYGSPQDVIGRRVRIEYRSHNWRRGICFLTAGQAIRGASRAMEVPSRGFRYAVAGGGSV